MAQRNRHDAPGQRHHLYNRGIARRVMFPDHRAKRRFIALLLCATRRGELLVEAFSVLDTHFHVLARSTDVPIGYPMMRVQNAYVRYINRRLQRDGTISRGRFGSCPVRSMRHAFSAVRYIDHNPVKAGICTDPAGYPYGTARVYAARDRGPAWLSRTLVDGFLHQIEPGLPSAAETYRKVFGAALSSGEMEVVEARRRGRAWADAELDALDGLPPPRVAAWMRRKAALADGLAPWPPILGRSAILAVLAARQDELSAITYPLTRKRWTAWSLLRVGLLHDTAGLGCEAVGRVLGCSSSTAGRRLRLHRGLLRDKPSYALLAGRLVAEALRATYPVGWPRQEANVAGKNQPR